MASKAVDLTSMNRAELEDLIKQAEKALSTLEERQRMQALRAAEKAVKEYGLSIQDVVSGTKSAGRKGAKNPPKYVHPDDPTKTWTGKGRKPAWINEALAKGKTLEDLAL